MCNTFGVKSKDQETGAVPVLATKIKNMEKLLSIKLLRPIMLPIIGALLIIYIIVAYVFDLEM
jgi:hypothetical protein